MCTNDGLVRYAKRFETWSDEEHNGYLTSLPSVAGSDEAGAKNEWARIFSQSGCDSRAMRACRVPHRHHLFALMLQASLVISLFVLSSPRSAAINIAKKE
jgi:hypothetical protein